MAETSHGGGQAFFEGSNLVKVGRNPFGHMAATSFSRRFHLYYRVILLGEKERRLSFDENRRIKNGMKRSLPAAVFFFTATAGRQK